MWLAFSSFFPPTWLFTGSCICPSVLKFQGEMHWGGSTFHVLSIISIWKFTFFSLESLYWMISSVISSLPLPQLSIFVITIIWTDLLYLFCNAIFFFFFLLFDNFFLSSASTSKEIFSAFNVNIPTEFSFLPSCFTFPRPLFNHQLAFLPKNINDT